MFSRIPVKTIIASFTTSDGEEGTYADVDPGPVGNARGSAIDTAQNL